ncbi:MAG: 4Fe-4S dicluster domain-containing protein [Candidatus Omnitrophica bacterium]|nr:4Fe-4S dicluster domain-containing protein [Candidatus Omnitrophota bacterium]
MDVDVLIIGAGPAGLSAAIRLKQKLSALKMDASVVVLDKAAQPGYHNLSGAAFEAACLDELLPGWRTEAGSFFSEMVPVQEDELYFLAPGGKALRFPEIIVPGGMKHKGDYLISLSRLVAWLKEKAEKAGVDVYTGLSARELIWDKNAVKGVRLVDQGRNKDGGKGENFQAGEEVLAKVTILADGSRGVLSREYSAKIGGNVNPQVYSIGIKQVFKLPPQNNFGANRVIHTLGFPSRPDVFGGGFFYSMGQNHLAAGLILGLDWKYTDLNPEQEFEYLKTHPFVAKLLEGAQLVAAGAKTIPEGGFFALPRLWTDGALVAGDGAGFVNMEKIKGIHYAVLSGMSAADAVAEAWGKGDCSADSLASYEQNLEARGVLKDLRHAKNYRAVFQWGVLFGAPLSRIQAFMPLRIPMGLDHEHTTRGASLKRNFTPAVNRETFASLSGTFHREDEPSHLIIPDNDICQRCQKELQSPCTAFCPVEVYRWKPEGVHISASNCVHCGTCAVKCPFQNIVWTPPEGGEGPKYKMM